jgi:hypothetical protein
VTAAPAPVASEPPAAPAESPAPAAEETPAAPAQKAPTPMKDWMTSSLARPVKQQDFAALERALHTTADYAPSEFADWRDIAERGARAAAARDIEAVRESCKTCHNEYRLDYREQMRSRPLGGVKGR